MIADATREAEAALAAARTRAGEAGAELLKNAELRADSVLKDAESRAEEAKRKMMQETEREIARAAMLAAEKILREKSA